MGVTIWDIVLTLLPAWAVQPMLYIVGLWLVGVGIMVPLALAKAVFVGKRDAE